MDPITVYSKPECIQCDATYRALDKKNIPYNIVDITLDPEALEKVVSMGYQSAPVVITGDQSWAGFRPDLIAQLVPTHAKELIAA